MKAHPYICRAGKCVLCLCQKLMIARANSASLLNKRDELFQNVVTWISLHWSVLRTDRMLFSWYCL